MQCNTNRYAIYWAPAPKSPLGLFGNSWLGRDPAGGDVPPRPAVPGLDADTIQTLVDAPARYGFHATLKPPFRLAGDANEDMLDNAVQALASRRPPVHLDRLKVDRIGRFIAIVPDPVPGGLTDLAADCVRELDSFRAPAPPDELARRRQAGLTPKQKELLLAWGYPYVLQEFRFHLTLSGAVSDTAGVELQGHLTDAAGEALGPVDIAELCVFREPAPGAPFELIARHPLTGT